MARKRRKSNRPKGHDARKIWQMAKTRCCYSDIAEAVGYTVTAIKVYLNVKFRDEADKLWAKEIKAVGDCELASLGGCSDGLNAHHLIEKSTHPHLRYDLSNGVCLCENHHLFSVEISAHKCTVSTDRFLEWLKEEREGQRKWYDEHKHDKAYQEVSYEQSYFELNRNY